MTGLIYASRLLDIAAGPDAAIRSVLRQTERSGLVLAIPGSAAQLASRRLHYDRITCHIDDPGQEGYALATLDFEGSLGSVEVSSLGLERIPFERDGVGWVPLESLAPRLIAVVAALEARRWALQIGDGEKLAALTRSPEPERAAQQDELFRRIASAPNRYRPVAWYIRLERSRALVTEDYRIGGGDGRTEEKGTRSLTLERHGSQFLFSGSLL